MPQTYSIAELSREFDSTPRTLRYYEDQGLLNPQRRGTTRIYSERDRTRLKLALRGRRLGLSVEECREVIDIYDADQQNEALQILKLLAKIRERRGTLLEKIRDIEATLAAMDEVENKCLERLLEKVG